MSQLEQAYSLVMQANEIMTHDLQEDFRKERVSQKLIKALKEVDSIYFVLADLFAVIGLPLDAALASSWAHSSAGFLPDYNLELFTKFRDEIVELADQGHKALFWYRCDLLNICNSWTPIHLPLFSSLDA